MVVVHHTLRTLTACPLILIAGAKMAAFVPECCTLAVKFDALLRGQVFAGKRKSGEIGREVWKVWSAEACFALKDNFKMGCKIFLLSARSLLNTLEHTKDRLRLASKFSRQHWSCIQNPRNKETREVANVKYVVRGN